MFISASRFDLDDYIDSFRDQKPPNDILNSVKELEELLNSFDDSPGGLLKAEITIEDPLDFDSVLMRIQGSGSKKEIFTSDWLLEKCTSIKDSVLDPKQLFENIMSILKSDQTDDFIQGQLVDLLGFNHLEFMQELISNRFKLRSAVTLTNVSQEALNTGGKMDDGYLLKRLRELELENNSKAPLVKSSVKTMKPDYPGVFSSAVGGNTLSLFGTKYSLPIGTERTDYKDYEEMIIPFSKPVPKKAFEKSVLISELDPITQRAFKGYSSLNRIQSIVYQTAFNTNENMLICAPTGCGKTDVAMLTVMRTVQQNIENQRLLDDFKIVYVAPMKALAAEITRKFASRLKGSLSNQGIGLVVKELTGDMQLTKQEIAETHMLVVTPEKWDVMTRKIGDTELVQKVQLIIVDEVHLLHDERGSVIESIIARTLRQVETSQSMIRIVGLSATLPNYLDVAHFLRVNPYKGLFYFDQGFRPCPLEQHFIGIKAKGRMQKMEMDRVCFEKVVDLVEQQRQVMIFVHSRKETIKTAKMLKLEAQNQGLAHLFESPLGDYSLDLKLIQKSKNKELKELFPAGFGIHHAGMLRADRNLVEQMFEKGHLRVLVCTATLAWGVNLPAYAVLIKGTDIYDAEKGSVVDLSILDVLQIFGRAGRPQYEDHGRAFILTAHEKLRHYISAMTMQHPIESKFMDRLLDNLNAEIALGTVTNVDEGAQWLSYTYLFVRMSRNPFAYGLNWSDIEKDKTLMEKRQELVTAAAISLHNSKMIYFNTAANCFYSKNVGRIASNYYISASSIDVFNQLLKPLMTEADILAMLSQSKEFANIKSRDEEMTELKQLQDNPNVVVCAVKGGKESNFGKTNILLQSYISNAQIQDFSLICDLNYVAQNSARIMRALFEICLSSDSRNFGSTAYKILSLCKSIDKRMWPFEHFLAQFDIPFEIVEKLEKNELSVQQIRDMNVKEIGEIIRFQKEAPRIKRLANCFPLMAIEAQVYPITRSVLSIKLNVFADFMWNDAIHTVEPFHIWVEDVEHEEILHSEYISVNKRNHSQEFLLEFTIPVPESLVSKDGLPAQITVKAISDKWLNSETEIAISFKHLILPHMNRIQHTKLLDLHPLPITALKNPLYEEILGKKFDYFNPIQTQIFHTLYYTKHNCLVGAPTGSGKTVCAELAMWSAFRDFPGSKVVYIAPLKALVRERVQDWQQKLCSVTGQTLVELTGDFTPDIKALQSADIIITTPEKFDGISRSWRQRNWVSSISLVIIDEIHLLGGDRGPILEVIVSRMNYISSQMSQQIRIVGLSTALANASDLGDWLHIKHNGLFNFSNSVRPVPLEIYIDAFPGKHYCPRMQSMNKPAYAAILEHSPEKPVLIFVSSRRQTRLTAQDLMSLLALDDRPKRFLHMEEEEMVQIQQSIADPSLRLCLGFGIGLHHAGLPARDRSIAEELFINNKIQVLVATSTLAWGVNTPAHLVIVKGTEFYDAKQKRYVDFALTDVLQMMGRAGRPQFDNSGIAKIFCQDSKKEFYKRFLNEPFPVESSLHKFLPDHLNAEISGGSVSSKQDAMDWLTWTYFYHRVTKNPTFYGVEQVSEQAINQYLSDLIDSSLKKLADDGCLDANDGDLESTIIGRISSYYYISHKTVGMLNKRLSADYQEGDFIALVKILCDAQEYSELAVRHNEDVMNQEFEKKMRFTANPPRALGEATKKPFGGYPQFYSYDSPHLKAMLLIQSHLSRITDFPISDYANDLNSVLDQAIRLLQAMIDVSASKGYLKTTLGIMDLMQCIKQGLWNDSSPLEMLPVSLGNVSYTIHDLVQNFAKKNLKRLGILKIDSLTPALSCLPVVQLSTSGSMIKNESESSINLRIEFKSPYSANAYCPKFPKKQTEGWWILVGDTVNQEIYLLKRFSRESEPLKSVFNVNLKFSTPESNDCKLEIIFKSDVYVGFEFCATIE